MSQPRAYRGYFIVGHIEASRASTARSSTTRRQSAVSPGKQSEARAFPFRSVSRCFGLWDFSSTFDGFVISNEAYKVGNPINKIVKKFILMSRNIVVFYFSFGPPITLHINHISLLCVDSLISSRFQKFLPFVFNNSFLIVEMFYSSNFFKFSELLFCKVSLCF